MLHMSLTLGALGQKEPNDKRKTIVAYPITNSQSLLHDNSYNLAEIDNSSIYR
jgi:hypothetical protein